jgi:altronate hydrolase
MPVLQAWREEMESKVNVMVINLKDNVAVALVEIKAGEPLVGVAGKELTAKEDIRRNHKVALAEIPAGGRIIKYGESIGAASRAIEPGQWVHTHNLKSEDR